uniref:4Fe-4S binding domain-containing protein n=1 Tax=Candidatus Kentrum sp. FW TaxID=2126338 RepID=A0A450THZ3_9GAMM|nr:MAG: 4Fe-4S binding domain-containing protein [Candidatus Kentron sp. FW]
MAMAIVREICTACGECEPLCPTGSIKRVKRGYTIDADTCTECEGEYKTPQCLKTCMEDNCIVPA